MGKAFADRPRWQRWGMIGGWGFLGFVVIGLIAGPEPAPSAGRKAATAADVASFRVRLNNLSAPCDAAQAAVGDGLQTIMTGDRIALARDVRRMEDACKSAWMAVDDLAAPTGLTDAQEDALDLVRTDCKTAFYTRGALAEALMPVIDGDMRPSVMAGIEQDMAGMQGDSMRCALALAKFDPPAPSPAPSADQ